MKTIIGDRGTGKTTELIKISAKTQNYIVCAGFREAAGIEKMAKSMNLKIPFPITYYEFLERKYYSKNINGFLIDDLERFFQVISTRVPINAITINNTPPNELPVQNIAKP